MNKHTLLKCAAMAGLLFLPCGSDAHDAGPVWITPSGYRLTGEDARREIEAAADRLPEGDSGWEFVAAPRGDAPPQAAAFGAFAPEVTTRWDDQFLYIEGNGMPSHRMMVGITAWQQQVPLPQRYTGANAWRIPLKPTPAKEPQMVKGRFLRGAIAIAANGIPIFNPQNNRGEISYEIGELDQWGGHCGRADDYHYHIVPMHLQKTLGKDKPLAYALDGYPIYGLTEPDGSQPKGLDALHGHSAAGIGYHYHAAEKYPYVIGGFHGEVTERDGQVDPQPRAQPVREALQALRGAKITRFEATGSSRYRLSYTVGGDERSVAYEIKADATYAFEFDDGRDGKRQETYRAGAGGGGGRGEGRPPRGEGGAQDGGPRRRPPPGQGGNGGGEPGAPKLPDQPRSSDGTFLLTSPAVEDGAELPVEFTGDGDGVTPPPRRRVDAGRPDGIDPVSYLMARRDSLTTNKETPK